MMLVLARSERGDVLMEYVVLTTCIVLPLIGVTNGIFDPSGQVFNPAGDSTGNFGILGQAFVGWYQRLVCGVGLPIP